MQMSRAFKLVLRPVSALSLVMSMMGLAFAAAPALAAPGKPVVLSEAATFGSGQLDASLEAKLEPGEQETTYHFEYGTSPTLTGAAPFGEASITENLSEAHTVGPSDIGGGLEPNTTYYYRVVATDASGTTEGPIQHFTTLNQEAPITGEVEPASITGTSARLAGRLNPLSAGTAAYQFSYNTGGSCQGGQTTTLAPPVTGTDVAVSTLVSGLEGNTEYTFCLLASSSPEATETISGASSPFYTRAIEPKVEGESSAGVTPYEAKLEALLNPENQATTSCVFQYGETTAYEHSAPCAPPSVEGSSDVAVALPVSGLIPNKTYHYRVLVGNFSGTAAGADKTFATLPVENGGKPLVESQQSSAVTPVGATLEAQVNLEYQQTSCHFEYASKETRGKTRTPSELRRQRVLDSAVTRNRGNPAHS